MISWCERLSVGLFLSKAKFLVLAWECFDRPRITLVDAILGSGFSDYWKKSNRTQLL